MRADSGYYIFIVAKRHRNLMNAVREIPESHWKSFAGSDFTFLICAPSTFLLSPMLMR